MNAAQFNKALERIEVSQAGFARLVGVTPRHANRWAAGVANIPRAVEIILDLWLAGTISEEDIEMKGRKKR